MRDERDCKPLLLSRIESDGKKLDGGTERIDGGRERQEDIRRRKTAPLPLGCFLGARVLSNNLAQRTTDP